MEITFDKITSLPDKTSCVLGVEGIHLNIIKTIFGKLKANMINNENMKTFF